MSLWNRIKHPCVWFTEEDYPRLRANAVADLWRPQFELWRGELADKRRLRIFTQIIDFHHGSNTEALKAALCYVVDGDEHYGRLIASFLEEVVAFYKDHGPTWRLKMVSTDTGEWVGQQWGGLSGSHIVDPMMWFSCAHFYDLVYDKGFLDDENSRLFEEMMAQFHQLCCLHEESSKLDNNRAAWLNGGSFLSAVFDEDEIRGKLVRERCIQNMEKLMSTFLDDGLHYEIGGYAQAMLSALHMSARCMRNIDGVDLFKRKFPNVGFEEAYRAFVKLLIPGGSLRLPFIKDRVSHWDSNCGGYLEYNDPELGWAISRMGERTWVPMFKHWPQGASFYTYREPDNAREPAFLDSHFTEAGIALMRSSWKADARTMYFRYGFQGSSHGGGMDKLNIELTCNDEPLLSDGLASEFSHDKNVVLVDYQNQEQCSGKLIGADLDESKRVQYISALGGFGAIPDKPVFHDPKIELSYWCTKYEECFPGVARARRTIAFVDRLYFIVRDTMQSLDESDHDYQWLFHTFARVKGIGELLGNFPHTYYPRKRFDKENVVPETRMMDRFALSEAGVIHLDSDKARLGMFFVARGAQKPGTIDLWESIGRYKYNGSPEKGDGFSTAALTTMQFTLRGRDVVMTTVLDARAKGSDAYVLNVESVEGDGLDREALKIKHAKGEDTIVINEGEDPFRFRNAEWHGVCIAE